MLLQYETARDACGGIDFGMVAQRRTLAGVGAACLIVVAVAAVSQFAQRDEELVAAQRNRADNLLQQLSEAEARHALELTNERRNTAALQARFAAELAAIERQRSQADARYGEEQAAVRKQLGESKATHAIALAAAQAQLADLRARAARADHELAAANQALNQANLALAQANQALQLANAAIADFKTQQAQRRLSYEEKRALIAALRFHLGHKVKVVATYGDDDAKIYAGDLAQVLDAAGWKLDPKDPVTFRRWDRSPVGVEVTLNEADARAGRLLAGMGTLINAVRKLGLANGNTVFMNSEVPSGEVELRVGRRLRGDTPPAPRTGSGPGADTVQ